MSTMCCSMYSRLLYNCTTTLLNVINDSIWAKDNGMITALGLLDFIKAFITINHELLLTILKYIDFNNLSVKLIKSFLCNRWSKIWTVFYIKECSIKICTGIDFVPNLYPQIPRFIGKLSIGMFADYKQCHRW